MTADQRREEIERRLRELRDERNREAPAVLQLSHTVSTGEPTVVVSVGDVVKIRTDMAAIEAVERLPQRDVMKEVYAGESGKVARLLNDFHGKGSAADVHFIDGVTKTFLLSCIDLGNAMVKHAQRGGEGPPPAVSQNDPPAKPSTRVPEPAAVAVVAPPLDGIASQPSWANLRRPGGRGGRLGPSAQHPTNTSPSIIERVPQPSLEAASVAVDSAGSQQQETQLSPKRRDEDNGVCPAEPKGSTQAPRGASSELPRSVPAAPMLALNSSSRAVADNEEDDLLRSPREDFGRSESWLKSRPRILAGGGFDLISPLLQHHSIPSRIPSCPPNYTPKFALGDPRSNICRPQTEATGVLHCTLIELDDYACDSSTPRSRKAAAKAVAFRSHQCTLEAILAACTTELDWARQGRRVQRLFIAANGSEVLFWEMIRDGCELVASDGAGYRPPPPPPPANSARSVGSLRGGPVMASRRPVSPAGQRPKLPAHHVAPPPVAMPSKPKMLRVYTNGEYGDVQGDLLPYRTVTVRPTCKTLKSVFTLLDRELQWNVLGRHVDMLYSCRGEEITSVDMLSDGDSIVASSGDRFIIPRSTSVLHREVLAHDKAPSATGGGSRRVSPVRPRSPTAVRRML